MFGSATGSLLGIERPDWSAVEARVAAGETPAALDPAVLSQAVVGMLARVIAWWAEDPTRATREEVIETLTRIQLSGTDPG